jgi:hypothetical protein
LQYFIGLEKYSNKEPFEASMLVHFQQRIGEESVAKKRKATKKQRKKAIKKQLQYIKRNLANIEKIADGTGLKVLKTRHYRILLIVTEVNRQQSCMYGKKRK